MQRSSFNTVILLATLAMSSGCNSDPVPTPSSASAASSMAPATSAAVAPSAAPPAPPDVDADRKFIKDLKNLCRITQEVNSDTTLPASVNKPSEMVRRFRKTAPEPEFMRFMRGLATTPPGTRYAAMEAEARKRGLPGWSCLELKAEDQREKAAAAAGSGAARQP